MKLALIGAGSMRAAPPAIASISLAPLGESELALWDPNEERLDLIDRFARTAFDATGAPITVRTTESADEAAEDADCALCCLGYDGALRWLGEFEEFDEGEDEVGTNLIRGDFVKVTPRDQLSPHLRSITRPIRYAMPRDEALRAALELFRDATKEVRDRLSLVRGPTVAEVESLAWPGEPGLEARSAAPHRILRFVTGDDYRVQWLRQFDHSPLEEWLVRAADRS